MVGLGRIRRIILIKKLEMLGFLLEDADNEAKKINEFKDALESAIPADAGTGRGILTC